MKKKALWFYTFPTLELFKEWARGAPERIAIHEKLMSASQAAERAAKESGQPLPISPVHGYAFHATDAPRAEIPAIRAELRELYRQIEESPWLGLPPGSIQLVMLGDHA